IKRALGFLPKKIASLIAIGMSAQLGTLPLTAWYFNIISPVSVLANLIVLPVLGVVAAGGFLIIPLGMIFPSAAVIAAFPIRFLCRVIFFVIDLSARLPYAYLRVVSPSIFTIIIIFLILLI